jgi:hypothetical protein
MRYFIIIKPGINHFSFNNNENGDYFTSGITPLLKNDEKPIYWLIDSLIDSSRVELRRFWMTRTNEKRLSFFDGLA